MTGPERVTYDHTPIVPDGGEVGAEYLQSIDDLLGLPRTNLVAAEELNPNMPNIFRAPDLWLQRDGTSMPLFFKTTKADVGGVGGHVEVSARVQATVLDFILRHNRITIGGSERAIFRSLFAHHTGDDVGISGVIDAKVMEHEGAIEELLWDAFNVGARVAAEEGLYAPGQDLKSDAFSGNIRGLGPATAVLPLPFRAPYNERNASQTVLLATADKSEPGIFNHLTTGAWLDPNFNTGLLIAESKMKNGYIFEIVDVDTKAQALEQGATAETLAETMEELGKKERFIELKGPEDYYDIAALAMNSSRFVIAKIYSRNSDGTRGALGVVVTVDKLHNIRTERGFIYGGKDDPVKLALCQGDWPAPGEIVSPLARTPAVAGDCRGSHLLPVFPMPLNEQTSFWSGPIMSIVTVSLNLETGRIGAISDQLARGTPWDQYRLDAAERMRWFRDAHGYKFPGVLPVSEIEYQPGYNERMARLAEAFQKRTPTT